MIPNDLTAKIMSTIRTSLSYYSKNSLARAVGSSPQNINKHLEYLIQNNFLTVSKMPIPGGFSNIYQATCKVYTEC